MKYRPSKRVTWLLIPLIPIAVMSLGLWMGGGPDAVDLATRGATAPPEPKPSLFAPGTWPTGDWMDEGMDAVMSWEYNPWKKHQTGFSGDLGERLHGLGQSDKPEDKAELERLKKLGREWYERILARYPDLAQAEDKEVPREENGFLQWSELMKRLRAEKKESLFETPLSQEMEDNFRKQTPQDPEAVKQWVDANRARIDEIRAIGLLPGQSAQGVADDDRTYGFDRMANRALLMDAQAAVAEGDINRAMESIRAANGLADHHSNIGNPTLYDTLVAASMRSQIQGYVLSTILPSLPGGQADVAAWQALLNPTLQQPSDFARSLRGEWNVNMPREFLPTMSDTKDPNTPPDADYLVESYTRHMREMALQADGMNLADYANSPAVNIPMGHLSRKGRDVAKSLGLAGEYDVRASFLRHQESTGLTLAAFAILRGQPIPVDPVYGLPYKWDPVKRTLSLPDPPQPRRNRPKPMTVPKM